MRTTSMKLACVVCVALLLVVAGGCKGKKEVPLDSSFTGDGSSGQTGGAEVSTSEALPSVDQERLLWDEATGLQTVYFDFDSYTLRPDAVTILQENAAKITQASGVLIQIEGHCDERGTQEYNMILGEKRALSIRTHLMNLGISGDRILTISHGEEVPAVMGHSEAAYSKNRRGEFNKAR